VLSNQDSHCKHLQPVAFLGTFEIHRSFAPLPSLWQILCRKRKFNFIRKTTKTDNKHLSKTKVKQTRPNGTYPLRTPRTRLRTKNDPQIMSVTKYNHGQELPTASLIWKENQNKRCHWFEHYWLFRLIISKLREWTRWTKSCVVIGYLSGKDGAILPARDYPLCPVRKVFFFHLVNPLLTKREVKMAGYWPCSFLHVYGPRLRLNPRTCTGLEKTVGHRTLSDQIWICPVNLTLWSDMMSEHFTSTKLLPIHKIWLDTLLKGSKLRQEPIIGFCHIIKQKCSSFLFLPNKMLFRNLTIMHYKHCDMLLALHVCTLESTLVRSTSLGACNSHTKPMSWYFYRTVYF